MKKKKRIMLVSKYVLFVLYIRKGHSTEHSSNFFQYFTTMSKITHMKKLIEDQYVLRSYFKVRQEVNDGLQRIIFYIKDALQNSIENNILSKTIKEKSSWLHVDELKELLTINPI